MIILASLIYIIGLIIVKIWHDTHFKVRHFIEWVCMAIASGPAIYLLYSQSNIAPYFQFYELTLPLRLPVVCAMVAFFIWFFFNGGYNVARKYKWAFTGSEDGKGDAFTDNILQWIEKRFGSSGVIITQSIPLILLIVFYWSKIK